MAAPPAGFIEEAPDQTSGPPPGFVEETPAAPRVPVHRGIKSGLNVNRYFGQPSGYEPQTETNPNLPGNILDTGTGQLGGVIKRSFVSPFEAQFREPQAQEEIRQGAEKMFSPVRPPWKQPVEGEPVDPGARFMGGVAQEAVPAAAGLVSPGTVALGAAAPVMEAAGPVLGSIFGAQGASQLPEAAGSIYSGAKEGVPAVEMGRRVGRGAAALGMAVAPLLHAGSGRPVPPSDIPGEEHLPPRTYEEDNLPAPPPRENAGLPIRAGSAGPSFDERVARDAEAAVARRGPPPGFTEEPGSPPVGFTEEARPQNAPPVAQAAPGGVSALDEPPSPQPTPSAPPAPPGSEIHGPSADHLENVARLKQTVALTPQEKESIAAKMADPEFHPDDLTPEETAKLAAVRNLHDRRDTLQNRMDSARSLKGKTRGAWTDEITAIDQWNSSGGNPALPMQKGDPSKLSAVARTGRMVKAVDEEHARDGPFQTADEVRDAAEKAGIQFTTPQRPADLAGPEQGDASFDFGENAADPRISEPAAWEKGPAEGPPPPGRQEPPETYFKGDRIAYTGTQAPDGFYGFKYLDGEKAGQEGVTARGPQGEDPYAERAKKEWTDQQEGFRRLRSAELGSQSVEAAKTGKAADASLFAQKATEASRMEEAANPQQKSVFGEGDIIDHRGLDIVGGQKSIFGKQDDFGPFRGSGASPKRALEGGVPGFMPENRAIPEFVADKLDRNEYAKGIYGGGPPEVGVSKAPIQPPSDRISLPVRFARMREEYAPIQHKYGQDVAGALAGLFTHQHESDAFVNAFEHEAYGKPGPEFDRVQAALTGLGYHNTAEALRAKGGAPSGTPDIGADQAERLRTDPKVANAEALALSRVEGALQAVRRRIGLPVNTRGQSESFQLNLRSAPPEQGDVIGISKRGKLNEMEDPAATGKGEYVTDPKRALRGTVNALWQKEAAYNFKDALDKNGLLVTQDKVNVNPFDKTKGTATIGKKETRMMPVSVPDPEGGPNLLRWAPADLVMAARKAKEYRASSQSDFGKVMDLGTAAQLAVGGDLGLHAHRIVGIGAQEQASSGKNFGALIPLVGGKAEMIASMVKMANKPSGRVMQGLLERYGGNTGALANASEAEPTSKLGKVVGLPHELLKSERFGVDTLVRRSSALAHYEALHDKIVSPILDAVDAGEMNEVEAIRRIDDALGRKDGLDMARAVNTSLGFQNRALRADWINSFQKGAPFLGYQIGALVGGIRRMATAGLQPRRLVSQVKAGNYGQATIAAAASLASGPIGTYMALHALNNWFSGHSPEENDPNHRLDLALSSEPHPMYITNLEPEQARSVRLMGLKTAAQTGDISKTLKGVATAGTNELISLPLPLLQMVVKAGLAAQGKSLYLSNYKQGGDQFGNLHLGRGQGGAALYPFGLGRQIAQSQLSEKGPTLSDAEKETAASYAGISMYRDQDTEPPAAGGYRGFTPPRPPSIYSRRHR